MKRRKGALAEVADPAVVMGAAAAAADAIAGSCGYAHRWTYGAAPSLGGADSSARDLTSKRRPVGFATFVLVCPWSTLRIVSASDGDLSSR
jgi:hypothetical protein